MDQPSRSLPSTPRQRCLSLPEQRVGVESSIQKSAAMWFALCSSTRKRGLQTEVVPEVIPNNTGIACIKNDHVLQIDSGLKNAAGEPIHKPIHAHRTRPQLQPQTHLQQTAAPTKVSYAAGQSPHENTYADFVLQGLLSGQGIFQFVSRKAHYQGAGQSKETPVIDLLNRAHNCALKNNKPIVLGQRFQVVSFLPIAGKEVADHKNDFIRYSLTVIDLHSRTEPLGTIIVPLTQTGLKFTGRVLRSQEIVRANELLNAHQQAISQPDNENALGYVSDQVILSNAGFGRNATLITYRKLCNFIDTKRGLVSEAELDLALQEQIDAERIRCGPRYVHSIAQLVELRIALLENLHAPQPMRPTIAQKPAQLKRSSSANDLLRRFSHAADGLITGVGRSVSSNFSQKVPPPVPNVSARSVPPELFLDAELYHTSADTPRASRSGSQTSISATPAASPASMPDEDCFFTPINTPGSQPSISSTPPASPASMPNENCFFAPINTPAPSKSEARPSIPTMQPTSPGSVASSIDDLPSSGRIGRSPNRLSNEAMVSTSPEVSQQSVNRDGPPDPIPFTRYSADDIDIKTLDLQFVPPGTGGMHKQRKLSTEDGGSWWRAAFASTLMEQILRVKATAENAAEELAQRIMNLGPNFEKEAFIVKEMAMLAQSPTEDKGIRAVLTEIEPPMERGLHNVAVQIFNEGSSRLKAVGADDEKNLANQGEAALKKIAHAMLLKAGFDSTTVTSLFDENNPREGDPIHLVELMNQLGATHGALYSRPWGKNNPDAPGELSLDYASATLDVFQMRSPLLSSARPITNEKKSLDFLINSNARRIVILAEHGHFSLLVPNSQARLVSMLRRTAD